MSEAFIPLALQGSESTNNQAPEKRQYPSSKFQRSSKVQAPNPGFGSVGIRRGCCGSQTRGPLRGGEGGDTQGGESEGCGEGLVVEGPWVAVDAAVIAEVAAAVHFGVAVEDFAPVTALGQAEAIVHARDGREVEGDHNAAGEAAVLAHEREDAVVLVSAIDPEEAFVIEVAFIHGGRGAIHAVEVFDEALQAAMVRSLIEQVPIDAAVGVPFVALADFATHEKQLLAGEEPLIAEQRAEVGEALPIVAGHAAPERAFAVNDFIVRERQDEI